MIADIVETLGGNKPRLVELGKIKIGGLGQARASRSGGAYRQPVKFDHFVITSLTRGAEVSGARGDLLVDKDLMQSLEMEGYCDDDGKLRSIPVRVLSDNIDDVLQSAWVWYGRKACGARTDGKTITWFYHPDTMKPYDEPVVEDFYPEVLERESGPDGKRVKMFKLHSVFNCVIAAKDARWGGVYKFRTTSLISFNQLYSSIVHISQLTGGVLTNMPLVLRVRPVQVTVDDKASTVHVVHLELMGSELYEIQKQALLQAEYRTKFRIELAATQQQYRKLLVGPGEENGEAAAIAEEFAPEAQELGAPVAPEGGYDLLDGDDDAPESPQPAPGPTANTVLPAVESDSLPDDAAGPGAGEEDIGGDENNAQDESPVESADPATVLPNPCSEGQMINLILQRKPGHISESDARVCAEKMVKRVWVTKRWELLSRDGQERKFKDLIDGRFPWPESAK